jgi:hypothetical protein
MCGRRCARGSRGSPTTPLPTPCSPRAGQAAGWTGGLGGCWVGAGVLIAAVIALCGEAVVSWAGQQPEAQKQHHQIIGLRCLPSPFPLPLQHHLVYLAWQGTGQAVGLARRLHHPAGHTAAARRHYRVHTQECHPAQGAAGATE